MPFVPLSDQQQQTAPTPGGVTAPVSGGGRFVPLGSGDTAAPDTWGSIAKNAGSDALTQAAYGLPHGIALAAGMPGDLVDLARKGANYLTGMDVPRQMIEPMLPIPLPRSDQLMAPITSVMGQAPQPKTELGRVTKSVAETAPGFVMYGPGSLPMRAASGVTSGLGAEAAGYLTNDNPWARFLGGAAGGLLPGAVTKFSGLGAPELPAPEAAGNQTLAEGGVPLSAGQYRSTHGSLGGLALKESKYGGTAAQALNNTQADAYTAHALSIAKLNGTRLTPELLDQGFKDTGKMFDTAIASVNLVPQDTKAALNVQGLAKDYANNVGQASAASVVQNKADDVANLLNKGFTGQQYQDVRSGLGKAIAGTSGQTRRALYSIQNQLDDVVSNVLPPDVQTLWTAARSNYRNMLILRSALNRGGTKANLGILTPAQLEAASKSIIGNAYTRPGNPMADWAKAGTMRLNPLPSSQTAERGDLRQLIPSLMGAAAGGTVGQMMGPIGAGFGATAGMALGRYWPDIYGATLMSPPVQYLLRQPSPTVQQLGQSAALGGLLGRRQAQ